MYMQNFRDAAIMKEVNEVQKTRAWSGLIPEGLLNIYDFNDLIDQ